DGGQSFHDGMLRLTISDLKRKSRAVGTGVAGRRIGNQLAVFVIPHGAGFFGALSPATDASHQIKFVPVREGVIGGVNDDHTSTVLNVVFELSAKVTWPVGSIVIPDDCLVFAELRLEVAEVAVGFWSRRNCDLE